MENVVTNVKSENTILRAIVFDVRLLMIGLWLGATVFFSFAVAPSVFAVLPQRDLAGAVVQRTLMIVNVSGFAIGLLLLASAFLFKDGVKRLVFVVEVVSLFLLAATTVVGHWVIAAGMRALRLQMGRPIDELAQNDPLRVACGQPSRVFSCSFEHWDDCCCCRVFIDCAQTGSIGARGQEQRKHNARTTNGRWQTTKHKLQSAKCET